MKTQPDIPNNLDAWYNNVPQPINLKTTIWRYMDFTKFVALLETKSLFFSRLDLLGDNFEGSYTKPHQDAFKRLLSDQQQHAQQININKMNLTYMFVSCWHMSEHENDALWKIYAPHNNAVAIKTSYAKLHDLPYVKAGLITYRDYEKEILEVPVLEACAMTKRHCFEYEQEVRALVWKQNITHICKEGKSYAQFHPNTITGIPISLNLSDFLERIVVSPTAAEWFFELVKKMLRRYRVNVMLSKSEIATEPYFCGSGFPVKDVT